MPPDVRRRLVNWGYAICDTALRAHFAADAQRLYGISIAQPAEGLPYPGAGLG
jgi:NTE family protein